MTFRTLYTFLILAYLSLVGNLQFFQHLNERTPDFGSGFVLTAFFYCLLMLILATFVVFIKHEKVFLISLTLLSITVASLSYFINELGVVIDETMILNLAETIKDNNTQEASELMSLAMVRHWLLLNLPLIAFFIFLKWKKPQLIYKRKHGAWVWGGLFLSVVVITALNFKYVTYFGRENRDLRVYINPVFPVISFKQYIKHHWIPKKPFTELAHDATREPKDKPLLGIIIVGETARSDHFAINGYGQPTTPNLSQEDIINFSPAVACGTSTAHSVPCMFSLKDREHFDTSNGDNETNLLDVLAKTGVEVHWIDNNSSCKEVCNRVGYSNMFKHPNEQSPYYHDGNLYDEAMLAKLMVTLSKDPLHDKLIVLHGMGSHGPAYHRRYPKEEEYFTPTCQSDSPQDCTDEEVINAYDNTIRYTDKVIAEVLDILKASSQSNRFLLYVSDHGESLGENGVYLHGMPYWMAPEAQTRVPLLFWLSDDLKSTVEANRELQAPPSHDHITHTLLSLYGVSTIRLKPELSLLKLRS